MPSITHSKVLSLALLENQNCLSQCVGESDANVTASDKSVYFVFGSNTTHSDLHLSAHFNYQPNYHCQDQARNQICHWPQDLYSLEKFIRNILVVVGFFSFQMQLVIIPCIFNYERCNDGNKSRRYEENRNACEPLQKCFDSRPAD